MENENCFDMLHGLMGWGKIWEEDLTPVAKDLLLSLIQEILESRVSETKEVPC